jgi:hypothetical protein
VISNGLSGLAFMAANILEHLFAVGWKRRHQG